MVTFGTVMSLAALAVSVFLGVYVLGVNLRGAANRAFFLLMLAFILWDATEAVQRAIPEDAPTEAILPWARATWVGISLVPATLSHLALVYPEPGPRARSRWALPLLYVPFALWAYAVLATDFVIDGVSRGPFGPSAHVSSSYPIAASLFAFWLYGSVVLFLLAWWRARKDEARPIHGVVVAGLLLGSIPAGITELFWPLLATADARLGLGSLYTLLWSVFIAYAVARYHYLVIEPVMERRLPTPARHGLERGLNYLVLEAGRSTAMGAFREIVSTTPGLCVTALPPPWVVRRFGLERTPIVWITTLSAEERSVRPGSLDFELVHTATKFLRENPGTAVLLDDLDYLTELNGFEAVARFVRRVTNQASASGGTVLLSAGRETLTPEQRSVLCGVVDQVLEVLQGPPDLGAPDGDHVLLLVAAQESPAALAAAGARRGLLLTTEHPAKARRRFGETYEYVWITESSGVPGPSVRPRTLDLEARRALATFMAAHPASDVVLAGLEQLALYNDFPTVLAFVKDTLDIATVTRCRLFVTLAPDSLPARETSVLLRRFDAPAVFPGLRAPPPSTPTTVSPGSRILYRGPVS